MNLLLLVDSHAFLWFAWGSAKLSATALFLMTDPNNYRYIGTATIWEIAVKISIGKLTLTEDFDTFMVNTMTANQINLLNVAIAHAAVMSTLPLHHRDPFDRMLVAQAQVEQMPLISNDPALDAYNIQRLW